LWALSGFEATTNYQIPITEWLKYFVYSYKLLCNQ